MINEDQVITRTVTWLTKNGYSVHGMADTKSTGVDIVAFSERKNEWLLIEAKGNTSSKEGSSRFGKRFTDSQCHSHVSVALYRVAQTRDNPSAMVDRKFRVGIAFGDSPHYRKHVERIRKTLKDLNVLIIWALEPNGIEVED
jgi:hypothetical protein